MDQTPANPKKARKPGPEPGQHVRLKFEGKIVEWIALSADGAIYTVDTEKGRTKVPAADVQLLSPQEELDFLRSKLKGSKR